MRLQCPFCGLPVDPEGDQFRWVTITLREGFWGKEDAETQGLACHHACLEARLGDVIPII